MKQQQQQTKADLYLERLSKEIAKEQLTKEIKEIDDQIADMLIDESVDIYNDLNSDEDNFWLLDEKLSDIADQLFELKAIDQLKILSENTGYGRDELDQLLSEENY